MGDVEALVDLSRSAPGRESPLVGVEHEFHLLRAQSPVDFRTLVDQLGLPGRQIDPGDNRAYRLRSGHVITCDEAEAEYAIAPVRLEPGFVGKVDSSCRGAAADLSRSMPSDLDVVGASTHISVSCPDVYVRRVASMMVRHYSPAIMLMSDDDRSFGMLVRPRFGRLECGLDYVNDAHLRATTAVVVGAVQTCLGVLRGVLSPDVLPPRLDVRVESARERFGLYVSRLAFGADLYRLGRSAPLSQVDGSTTSAGDHLETVWKTARQAVIDVGEPSDVNDADDMVSGVRQIPCEGGRSLTMLESSDSVENEFTGVVDPVVRPRFRLSAVVLSWELGVFVASGERRAYAVVPRRCLREFIAQARNGDLDETVDRFLAAPEDPTNVVPAHPEAIREPALFDGFGDRGRLATPERTRRGSLRLADGTPVIGPTLLPPAAPTVFASAIDPESPGQLATSPAGPASTQTATESSSGERMPPKPKVVPLGDPPPGSNGVPPVVPPPSDPTSRGGPPWIWILGGIALAVAVLLLILWLSGDDSSTVTVAQEAPSETVEPRDEPTTEPSPTSTSTPTATPVPTSTPAPTSTPTPEPAQGRLHLDHAADSFPDCDVDQAPTDLGHPPATDLDTVQIVTLDEDGIKVSLTVRGDLEAYLDSNPESVSAQLVFFDQQGRGLIVYHELHQGELTTEVTDIDGAPLEGASVAVTVEGTRVTFDVSGIGALEGGEALALIYSTSNGTFGCDPIDEPFTVEVSA